MKSLRFKSALLLLNFIGISGCMKEEQAVTIPKMTSTVAAQNQYSKLMPLEQIKFQNTLKEFPTKPASMLGTREGDEFDKNKNVFIENWKVDMGRSATANSNTSINGWICIANGKQDQEALNSCHPVDSDSKFLTMIAFHSIENSNNEKYYKGDLLKVSGEIFQTNFSDGFLYQIILNKAEIEILKKN